MIIDVAIPFYKEKRLNNMWFISRWNSKKSWCFVLVWHVVVLLSWMLLVSNLRRFYDSGSTGKPMGVLHTVAGYMLYSATTFKFVFDYHPGEVYWCTADVGWITGHTYTCYGPLNNGATGIIVSEAGRSTCTSMVKWNRDIERWQTL